MSVAHKTALKSYTRAHYRQLIRYSKINATDKANNHDNAITKINATIKITNKQQILNKIVQGDIYRRKGSDLFEEKSFGIIHI